METPESTVKASVRGYDLQGNGSAKVFLMKWCSSRNLKDEQRFRRSGCLSREDSRQVDKEQSE